MIPDDIKSINIRNDTNFYGQFLIKSDSGKECIPKTYGELKIYKGHIYLTLIGELSPSFTSTSPIKASYDGYIIGDIKSDKKGYIGKFITKNYYLIYLPNQPRDSFSYPFYRYTYRIHSFSINQSKDDSSELSNCSSIILNIDSLSHYFYDPSWFKKNKSLIDLGNITFKNIKYSVKLQLHGRSRIDLDNVRRSHKRWINIIIKSTGKKWYKYNNVVPLSNNILKFIQLLTRKHVNITNIVEQNKDASSSSVYVKEINIRNDNRYNIGEHPLRYSNLRKYFPTMLNRYMHRSHYDDAIINAILSVYDSNNVKNDLLNCTNGIQIYYSDDKKYRQSLKHKLCYLVKGLPDNIINCILNFGYSKCDKKDLVNDIRATRVYIVHGIAHPNGSGTILRGIPLMIKVSMLIWMIYSKALLDINVPSVIICKELEKYMMNTSPFDYLPLSL